MDICFLSLEYYRKVELLGQLATLGSTFPRTCQVGFLFCFFRLSSKVAAPLFSHWGFSFKELRVLVSAVVENGFVE